MLTSNPARRAAIAGATACAASLAFCAGAPSRAAGALAQTAATKSASPAASKAASKPASHSPLTDAKTIQVHGRLQVVGKGGELTPMFTFVASIARPSKVRLDLVMGADADQKAASSYQFLSDGSKTYEYNGVANEYRTADAPAPGQPMASGLCEVTGINMILDPDRAPFGVSGGHRTVTAATLNGRAVSLTTDVSPPRKMQNGTTMTVAQKVWASAVTRLPVRSAIQVTSGGDTKTVRQIDFSDWSLGQAIPDDQFTWKAPAGAKLHVDPTPLAIGVAAPDFTAAGPSGPVHLSDFKGKPVVIDFWATWCGPCQQSMPHLEKVYKQLKDKGVAVLAICVWDEKAAYDTWRTQKKDVFTFPVAFDSAGRSAKSIAMDYGVTGIPSQFVIDKNGKVAAETQGYSEGSHELEDALAKVGVNVNAAGEHAAAKK